MFIDLIDNLGPRHWSRSAHPAAKPAEAADLMAENTSEQAQDFYDRATELRRSIESKIRDFMHSDQPGVYAVPRAVLYRYWKRIVSNLAGVVTGVAEPLQNLGYLDDGQTDIDD